MQYTLPELPYKYDALKPNISGEQLKLHHQKHHLAYVNGANAVLEKLEKARKENAELDMKAVLKELSFHIGGHLLHSLFWANLRSPKKDNKPKGKISALIKKEFGGFERFRQEFTKAAASVEGSGWAALAYCGKTQKLMIMQIEKHNTNVYLMFRILLVVDVWEHVYYLDYKNERGKFVDAFWELVNWDDVNKRLEEAVE